MPTYTINVPDYTDAQIEALPVSQKGEGKMHLLPYIQASLLLSNGQTVKLGINGTVRSTREDAEAKGWPGGTKAYTIKAGRAARGTGVPGAVRRMPAGKAKGV